VKRLLLVAILALTPLIQAHHKKGHQSLPLELLAVGQPVDCGKLQDFVISLRRNWESDKRLMRKGIRSPMFKKDFLKLYHYEELFALSDCRVI